MGRRDGLIKPQWAALDSAGSPADTGLAIP
jgi:hypothetical protein